jgi:hypothetical protein
MTRGFPHQMGTEIMSSLAYLLWKKGLSAYWTAPWPYSKIGTTSRTPGGQVTFAGCPLRLHGLSPWLLLR